MAPERFTTGRIDARSDIYALACVLYECLTSSRPFPGNSVEQQIAGHLTAPPPRPSVFRPGVSPQLDTVVAAGMAKDPAERYGTTVELARAARSAITASVPKPPSLPDSQHTAAGVAPWAPTQARPAEHAAEPWAPTQARPAEATAEPWTPTQARPGDDRPWVLPPPDRDTTDQ